MSNSTNVYAEILKFDDNGDGTLTVYGKATDDSLDIDEQICDPVWLDRAMPDWFRTGGNIREQHSNIAAGVAKEYESKADGHYISALVVDPVSVKKVQNRVLRGFSIGIKSPRVVRDTKAANGRIIDGQIVEVSLVDRPANPNCQLILAKSVIGEKTLLKTEELIEKYNEEHDESGRFGSGGGGSDKPEESQNDNEATRQAERRDDAVAKIESSNVDEVRVGLSDTRDAVLDIDEDKAQDAAASIKEAQDLTDSAMNSLDDAKDADSVGSHAGHIEDAVRDLEVAQGKIEDAQSSLGQVEYDAEDQEDELSDMHDEIESTLESLETYLDNLYGRGEEKSATNKNNKEPKMARQRRAAKSAIEKEVATNEETPMNGEAKTVPSRDEMIERYASARKALDDVTMECKSYGYDDIDKAYGETAEEESAEGPAGSGAEHEVGEAEGKKELVDSDGNETDKSSTLTEIIPDPSIETLPTTTEETIEEFVEDDSASKTLLADARLDSIIEKAVKSAMKSVEVEVAELKTAYTAVENKAASLETELATAKSLAIGGGPKRATIATGATTTNEWKAKADLYFAKASSTTDQVLAKGYRDMAKDFLAKTASSAETN